MPTTITGTDGVSQVQAGAVESSDLPAGSVIQVVGETFYLSSRFTTTSTSYVDTGVGKQISLVSASSKVLVSVDIAFAGAAGANAQSTMLAVARGSTVIFAGNDSNQWGHFFESDAHPLFMPVFIQNLDPSPGATTVTYNL